MKLQAETYLTACGIDGLPRKNKLTGWQILPVTESQKKKLWDLGLGYSQVKYQGQANFLFDVFVIRKAAGMASPKQLAILIERGYSIKTLCKLSSRSASKRIGSGLRPV